MGLSFAERLYPRWTQCFQDVTLLAEHHSKFQTIEVYDTHSHGRMLVLDGAVQITTRDEFIYQEMIAHVPLFIHPCPKQVLIIGAGDGGVLRRVLAHKTVQTAIMVEIDPDVIRLSKQYLPDIASGAWDDPRAQLLVTDGIAYVAGCESSSMDVILIDSTDPAGVGEVLFTEEFYRQCARVLRHDGIMVNQGGVPFMQPEELRQSTIRRRAAFSSVSGYVVAVPTYIGGFMVLGIASNSDLPYETDLITLKKRAAQSGFASECQYWTPNIHAAAFALPPYIACLLK